MIKANDTSTGDAKTIIIILEQDDSRPLTLQSPSIFLGIYIDYSFGEKLDISF